MFQRVLAACFRLSLRRVQYVPTGDNNKFCGHLQQAFEVFIARFREVVVRGPPGFLQSGRIFRKSCASFEKFSMRQRKRIYMNIRRKRVENLFVTTVKVVEGVPADHNRS